MRWAMQGCFSVEVCLFRGRVIFRSWLSRPELSARVVVVPGCVWGDCYLALVLGFVAVRRVEGLLSVNDLEMLACGFVCCCKFT